MDPTELNRVVLYTLNHFTEWLPPHLIIATPLPCSAEAEGFLKLMTSSVSSTVVVASSHVYIMLLACTELFTFCCSSSPQLQAYALGEMSKGEHLGYTRQGCDKTNMTIISLKDESSVVSMYRIIATCGLVSLAIFESVLLLQVLLKALSQKMESCNYSFDYYGMFWGMSAILCMLYIVPVTPFAVTVNVLLLVLTSTCLTYIMALIFTICAFVGSRRCLSNSPDCLATVRAAMLIPLLFTVICFSLFVALIGQFVNIATQQSSFHMILKSLFAPVLLVVVSLSLKRFISVWMHWSLSGVEDESKEANSLRRHDYQEYQVLDNV